MAKKVILLSDAEARRDAVIGKVSEVENLVNEAAESVDSVRQSVFRQMQNIMEVAEMGSRLNDASKGLMELQDNSGLEFLISENAEYTAKIHDAFRLLRELAGLPQIKRMERESHREELSRFLKDNDFIEAAWSNDTKGRFICSIPEAGIANAKIRIGSRKASRERSSAQKSISLLSQRDHALRFLCP